MDFTSSALTGKISERSVVQLPRALATLPRRKETRRHLHITCATAASARVKEAPEEIVQPADIPKPLLHNLESSSVFAEALPSFGEEAILSDLRSVVARPRLLSETLNAACDELTVCSNGQFPARRFRL